VIKIKINKAKEISRKILLKIGFNSKEADLTTRNLIEAELSGKKTHGLIRLFLIKKRVESKIIKVFPEKDSLPKIISETENSIFFDIKHQLGIPAIYQSLTIALKKIKETKICCVGLKNLEISGYIGDYAREATEKELIFLGFNNSPAGLIPHGTTKKIWGTNPITIAVPTFDIPVILDMASSKITYGDLLISKNENKTIESGLALNKEGKATKNPSEAIEGGGLLPFFGHKGSGLALIVELLAGALTGSRVGNIVPGGWGSFYVLIDPSIFRKLKEFKTDVEKAIKELKNNTRAENFQEVFFPGERSHKLRKDQISRDYFEISQETHLKLLEILRQDARFK